MTSIVSNGINSAIVSAQFGIQNGLQGVTQASLNIAQQNAQLNVEQNGPEQLLASASIQNLSNVSSLLPQGSNDPISNLVSLQVNALNVQASANVLDVVDDTVGTIIDTLA